MTRILMATDLSAEAGLAQRRATLLNQAIGGSLRVVHVPENDTAADSSTRFEAVDKIPGDPYEIISDLTQHADLLVLGEPRRRAASDLFTGTTGERIIRSSSAPVLVVRNDPVAHYRRTLFAVDLTADGIDMMRISNALGLTSTPCDVVHVYESPQADLMIEAATYSFDDIRRHIANQSHDLRKKLRSQMKKAELSGHAAAIPIESSPAATILSHAKKINADLIVVGSRRRSNLARLVMGSVAAHVLSHADGDVLVVPPKPDEQHR